MHAIQKAKGLQKTKKRDWDVNTVFKKDTSLSAIFTTLKFQSSEGGFYSNETFHKTKYKKRINIEMVTLGTGKTELLYPLLSFQLPSNYIYKTLRCQ